LIKKVSIQLNMSLICGGVAIVEREDGIEDCIFFDVVKTSPIKIIVGSRGKNVSISEADNYERALLDLFVLHKIPLRLGTYSVTA